MKGRNEVTGKEVTEAASRLLRDYAHAQDLMLRIDANLSFLRVYFRDALKVAASALTQTPDKPKRKRK